MIRNPNNSSTPASSHKTYIDLNIPVIKEVVAAHRACGLDEDNIYKASGHDEVSPHEACGHDESAPIVPVGTVHIHKGTEHKELFRKDKVKVFEEELPNALDEKLSDLEARMQSTIFTADYFFECCRIIEQMVKSKINHGDSEENIMNFLLSSALSSVEYPAFARIYYMVHNMPEAFNTYSTTEIVYQLRTEWTHIMRRTAETLINAGKLKEAALVMEKIRKMLI
jgi:hypothetical protein